MEGSGRILRSPLRSIFSSGRSLPLPRIDGYDQAVEAVGPSPLPRPPAPPDAARAPQVDLCVEFDSTSKTPEIIVRGPCLSWLWGPPRGLL